MKKIVFISLIIILLIIPLIIKNNFVLRFATDTLIFAILASAWNIIGGYTGYASFGNVVFFGIGVYSTSILMSVSGLNFLISFLLSGIISALFAFIIGLPILRLKGHYFAIATLGVAEAVKALVQNLEITEGNSGIYLPPPDLDVDKIYMFFFYLSFIILVLLLLITKYVLKRKFGYNMIAVREDEESANSMGINSTMVKVGAFSLSAFFTGFAGSIYAYQQGFIKPEPVFNVLTTVKMIVMAVFGGLGSLFGPLIGAVSIEMISEFLSSYLLTTHTLFLGIIIILTIIFAPKGLIDVYKKRKLGFSYFLKNSRKNKV
jgi:branched-chain amino acid transport system permease protein